MFCGHRLAVISLLFASATYAHAAPRPEKLSIISNGEVVGSVAAVIRDNHVSVDYAVNDNGRGPKYHEELVLGPHDIPLSWVVSGTSLMGGPVAERYNWEAGVAHWSSQADKGSVPAPQPQLYIINDDNPWDQGVYARAALAAPGRSLDVLPGGRLTLTKLRDMTIGVDGRIKVGVYRIDGVQLAPSYLMLDLQRRLFATFSATSVAIRSGYEKSANTLLALGAQLETERVRAISASVTHRYDVPIRIRNVRIFDPLTGTIGPLSTVVVSHDRVSAVFRGDGAGVPNDEVVVDGEGGTIYPGLHDMHSHTTLDSGLFYLAAGVTGTRDMGNKNDFLQALLAEIEKGAVAGPRIVPDGFIEGRSPYSARNGFVIDSIEEGLNAVHWYADHGYFQIKIYNSMNPAFVKPLADEAHRLGMGVTGHVPAFDTPDRVIQDGYDTIAHVNQLMLGWILDPTEDTRTALRLTAMVRAADLDLASPRVQATLALMKAHRTSLDTTAVILERLMLSRAETVEAGDADYLDHVPIGYQRYRKRSFVPLKSASEDQAYVKSFGKVIAVMRMLHANGIRMLPGTDDTTGFTLQREVELYTKAGMSNAEALKAATLDCEVYFGHSGELGTIERGKLADLVLVAGDPTKDINAIKRPRMVMKGGAVYLPSEIYAALSIKPFTSPPPITAPPAATTKPTSQGASALFGPPLDDGDDERH